MPYTLSFKDRYLRIAESKVVSDTSESQQFYFIPDNEEQLIRTKWTGKQWHKLLTCIETGADLMFPDEANEIIWQFIKTLTVPPAAPSENECFEYLPSATFVKYFPDNPYVAGDTHAGWWNEVWFQWADFFSLFPDFAADWLAGAVGGLIGYNNTDVLCNIAALAYPTLTAFFDAGGVFPKFQIKFSGTGQINVSLLSFPLGGKAIIELDEEPNILDILTGGILDPAAFMVELNRDILSYPPDEYPLLVIPIEVTTPGPHILYINFIPILDDAATFLGFGGGIRSLELCGFAEVGTVGIEQVIWDGCAIKTVTGGVETVVVTAEEIQACMDIPEGGGGGAAALTVYTHAFDLAGNVTNNTTSYINAVSITYTPQHSKMLVVWDNITLSNSAGAGICDVRTRFNSLSGVNGTIIGANGSNGRESSVADWFDNLTPGAAHTLGLELRSVTSSNTATIGSGEDILLYVIEFDDIADLFVEDIRYLDGVLQKKLAGVWLDVVDIEALLAPIQSLASAANTAAANALTIANGAVSVNSAQQTVLNNHETRIDTLEDKADDYEDRITSIETIDLPQINLTLANHESRIDTLEASSGGGGANTWDGVKLGKVEDAFSALAPGSRYTLLTGSYLTSPVQGYQASGGVIEVEVAKANRYGSCRFVGVQILILNTASTFAIEIKVNDQQASRVDRITIGANQYIIGWVAVDSNLLGIPPHPSETMEITVTETSGVPASTHWRLIDIKYLCSEINPFTDTLLP